MYRVDAGKEVSFKVDVNSNGNTQVEMTEHHYNTVNYLFFPFVSFYVIKKNALLDDLYNPELHPISREYPEQARFQSNITMQGPFLVTSMLGSITR